MRGPSGETTGEGNPSLEVDSWDPNHVRQEPLSLCWAVSFSLVLSGGTKV